MVLLHTFVSAAFKTQKDEQVAMLLKAVDSLKEETNALNRARENDNDVRQPSEAAGEGTGRPISTSGKHTLRRCLLSTVSPLLTLHLVCQTNHDNIGVDECPSVCCNKLGFTLQYC